MNKNEQGQWMWTREQVEAHGLLYAGITLPDSAQYRLRAVCIDLDVTLDSVHAFRIAQDQWEVFYRPIVTHGYKDIGILAGM